MNETKKAWIISTSPSKNFKHVNGATFRTDSIVSALTSSGYDVHKTSFGVGNHFDISLPPLEFGMFNVAKFSDSLKTHQFEKLKRIAEIFTENDLVVLDQPFMWPTVESIIDKQQILYVAHNFESHAYFQILRITGFDWETFKTWESMSAVEENLMRRASAIICLSDSDEKVMKTFCKNVITVPTEVVAKERNLNADPDNWTFVSSNWPANWLGIIHLIDPSVLKSEKIKLNIVGSCLDSILTDRKGANWIEECGESINKIGVVSDSDLETILEDTYGSIIPVLMGGGANYKIAESMSYGHRIISTTFGARGYNNVSGVSLADSRSEFSSLLKRRLDLPPSHRDLKSDVTMHQAIIQILAK